MSMRRCPKRAIDSWGFLCSRSIVSLDMAGNGGKGEQASGSGERACKCEARRQSPEHVVDTSTSAGDPGKDHIGELELEEDEIMYGKDHVGESKYSEEEDFVYRELVYTVEWHPNGEVTTTIDPRGYRSTSHTDSAVVDPSAEEEIEANSEGDLDDFTYGLWIPGSMPKRAMRPDADSSKKRTLSRTFPF